MWHRYADARPYEMVFSTRSAAHMMHEKSTFMRSNDVIKIMGRSYLCERI